MKKLTLTTLVLLTCVLGCPAPPEPYQIIPYNYEPCKASQVGTIIKTCYQNQSIIEYMCSGPERRTGKLDYYQGKEGYYNSGFEYDYYYDDEVSKTTCYHGCDSTGEACKKINDKEYTPCTPSDACDSDFFCPQVNTCDGNLPLRCKPVKHTYTPKADEYFWIADDNECEDSYPCKRGECVPKDAYDWYLEPCDASFKPYCNNTQTYYPDSVLPMSLPFLIDCRNGFTGINEDSIYISAYFIGLYHPQSMCLEIGDKAKHFIPCDESEVDGQSHSACYNYEIADFPHKSLRYSYKCRYNDEFGPRQYDIKDVQYCDNPCGENCEQP